MQERPSQAGRTSAVEELRTHLDSRGVEGMIGLLAAAWDHLVGSDDEAMAPHKLARLEDPEWNPPILKFMIERHGALMRGSTRAELQTWFVDLDARTAERGDSRRRQLRPTNPRLDVRSIARELAQAIVAKSDDPRIRWNGDIAHPVMARSLPTDGVPKRTAEARRRRLRKALDDELAAVGWKPLGQGRYVSKARREEGPEDSHAERR